MTLVADVFRQIPAPKNMAPLENSLFSVNVVALKKVSFSNTQNPKTFC